MVERYKSYAKATTSSKRQGDATASAAVSDPFPTFHGRNFHPHDGSDLLCSAEDPALIK